MRTVGVPTYRTRRCFSLLCSWRARNKRVLLFPLRLWSRRVSAAALLPPIWRIRKDSLRGCGRLPVWLRKI